MQGSDVRCWLGLLPLSLLACSQDAEVRALDWHVAFDCDADRADSGSLQLRILRGGCGGSDSAFTATVSAGGSIPTPPTLAPGVYGFAAEAERAGQALARGCVQASLPTSSPIETRLSSLSNCLGATDGAVLFDAGPPPPDADIESGITHVTDASEDAAVSSCACDGCMSPCACAGDHCFSSRLFVSYSGASAGTWRASSNLTVGHASILRVGFDPARAAGARVLAQPAPLVVLEQTLFDGPAELDAFAILPDGRYLLSTRGAATLGTEPFDANDLIAFEPLNQQVSRYLDVGSFLSAVDGSEVDVDAIHVTADGTLYFSVDAPVRNALGAVFAACDLLLFHDTGITRLVDGAMQWDGRDLESLAVDPESGHFLVSLSGTGQIGAGESVAATDLIELSFGPEQSVRDGYRVFMSGSQEFLDPAGTLSAIHFGQ